MKRENLSILKLKYPKIKDEIMWRWDGECEEHIVFVDPKYLGVALNPVAAEIFYMCDGCHTVDRMVNVLKARYKEISEEELKRDLLGCLREFERYGVLTDANRLKR